MFIAFLWLFEDPWKLIIQWPSTIFMAYNMDHENYIKSNWLLTILFWFENQINLSSLIKN